MNNLKPDKGIIEDHLCRLFEWTSAENKFEIRCIHPTEKAVRSKIFGCRDYTSAADFAVEANRNGYNIYATVNPLRPDIAGNAKDADVLAARWHFIDVDGTDDPYEIIKANCGEFTPSMVVVTGTEPTTRLHGYWLMSEPVDFTSWSKTQKGLAAAFKSDPSVVNPSRIMRLAGTLSFPDDKKAGRGYVPELVTLIVSDAVQEVDVHSFMAGFPVPQLEKSAPVALSIPSEWPQEATAGGYVPLEVIGQALAAIPPVVGHGCRKGWLALAMATKAANPGARSLFDHWQRLSPEYDRSDERVWDTISPDDGSYPNLFTQARGHDPDWWRDGNPKVEMWWRQHISETFGADQPMEPTGHICKEPTKSTPRFHRHKMSDLKSRPTPKWLIRDLIFQRQIGVVYAPPTSFKSFVALDLCSRLVHGLEWQVKKLKPCRVVYVAGEGFPMFYNRRLAWFKHHSIPVADDGLEVVGSSVDLTSTASVSAFIVEMKQDCDGVGLIVFDTLSTCTAGQNESDSAVMTSAIENAKLIGSVLGAAVLLIHHPGKDATRGARGHSSLKGNVDTEWLITRNEKDMRCTLKVTKQKDAEDGQLFHFTAHRVPLGLLDDDGVEMFSLALTPSEAPLDVKVGKQIPIKEADRETIATLMKVDDRLSVNRVAKLIHKALSCGVRTATDRVKAAVPSEWTSVQISTGVVELRQVPDSKNDKWQVVQMRVQKVEG